MLRNLDLTALRSFLTVVETGGVTRAAGVLNLTQSAVSMQLKRLEDSLGIALLDRAGRGIAPTAAGEQLAGYARRILALNDEVFGRLTATEYEGELRFGVPHDIIYPYLPRILKRFSLDFPRMRIQLATGPSLRLKAQMRRGELDVILTTEAEPGPGGEVLTDMPLVWIGAVGGTVWRERPLRLAICNSCVFRPDVIRRVDAAGMAWENTVDSPLDKAVEAAVSADLAISVSVADSLPPLTEVLDHGGSLPDLGRTRVILYRQAADDPVVAALSGMLRQSYAGARGGARVAAE